MLTSMDAFRQWLTKNKIFIEVAGLILWPVAATVILTAVTLLLGVKQIESADYQNRVAYTQACIAQQQTSLLELQATVARSQISPKWQFDCEVMPPRFVIKNTGEKAYGIVGTCLVYVEVPGDENQINRVLLADFYRSTTATDEGLGKVTFFSSDTQQGHQWLAWNPDRYTGACQVKKYLSLKYFDVTGKERLEEYTIKWPGSSSALPSSGGPPPLHSRLDLFSFFVGDKADYPAVRKAFASAISAR